MVAAIIVSGLVALGAVIVAALVVLKVVAYLQGSTSDIHEAELSMRIHLQAQVDDLHAKVLTTEWENYANTVTQRSAFDRAVAAEEVRHPRAFRNPDEVDRELANMGVGAVEDDGYEGGPIVG